MTLFNDTESRLADAYMVYGQHKGSNISMPFSALSEIAEMAQCAATNGYDELYRVFRVEPNGAQRFVTAWSVLDGVVREHRDVTIPAKHF